MTFDRFLHDRVFVPLGMTETFFVPQNDAQRGRIPTTYHRADGTIKATEAINNLYEPTYFSGGGGLRSTAEDYAKFAAMLLGAGQVNGHRLLSPENCRANVVSIRSRHMRRAASRARPSALVSR